MPHPGRNNIYEAVIKRMVQEALEEQEQAFAQQHGADSDEQLLEYLRTCTGTLGHTPWPREIPGGSMILKRFGTWRDAVLAANLPLPSTPDKITGFARYQEEIQHQKVRYREKKAAKKLRAQQRLKEQREKQARS